MERATPSAAAAPLRRGRPLPRAARPHAGGGAARHRSRLPSPCRCLFIAGRGPTVHASAAAAPLRSGRLLSRTASPCGGRGAARPRSWPVITILKPLSRTGPPACTFAYRRPTPPWTAAISHGPPRGGRGASRQPRPRSWRPQPSRCLSVTGHQGLHARRPVRMPQPLHSAVATPLLPTRCFSESSSALTLQPAGSCPMLAFSGRPRGPAPLLATLNPGPAEARLARRCAP